MTIREISEILSVSYLRAYELARRGLLPGVVRIGRQVRIRPDAFREFIDSGGRALPGGWRRQPKAS